jgi:hypothetical protein
MRKDFSRGLSRNHAHICQAATGRGSNLETSSQSLGEPRLSVSGEVQPIGQRGITLGSDYVAPSTTPGIRRALLTVTLQHFAFRLQPVLSFVP